MKVTVAITVLNEAASVGPLLSALASQTRLPDEVVVVDGGSADDTPAALRASGSGLPLRVIEAPGTTISQGRNRSVRESVHGLLAVTDADCRPDPTWLENLTVPFEEGGEIDLVCGSYQIDPRSDFEECVGRCSGTDRVRIQGRSVRPTARSLAFTRKAWQAVGGFPEQTEVLDDLGFILAVAEAGFIVGTAPGAVVRWRPRSTYRAVLRQFHRYARDSTRGRRTVRMYGWTLIQDAIISGLLLWGILSPRPLPWLLLVVVLSAYLYAKIRHGCWKTPGWRTLYRVPLILAAIHLGVLTGIMKGFSMRVREHSGERLRRKRIA